MGRPEPDAASSSPSARLRIQSLARNGTIGQLRLELSDGSSFSFPEASLAEAGLQAAQLEPGMELEEQAVARLGQLDRASRVHERALRLLAGGAHSTRGLERKLLARGAEQALVTAELDRLTRAGLLDDRAYAAAWIRRRLERHPEGPGPLQAGLQRRGVGRELAGEAVQAEFTEDAARAAAYALLAKLRRRSDLTPERIEAALSRRGFRRGLIREILGD